MVWLVAGNKHQCDGVGELGVLDENRGLAASRFCIKCLKKGSNGKNGVVREWGG